MMNLINQLINQVWPRKTQTDTETDEKPQRPRTTCKLLENNTIRSVYYNTRTMFTDSTITIFGWPSRGGVIVLERADAIDFDFLGLSRLHPPLRRAVTPEAEDDFCQRLLLLGATCFTSFSRWQLRSALESHDNQVHEDYIDGKLDELTLAERLWVKVAWIDSRSSSTTLGLETGPAGNYGRGFWVGEWDTSLPGIFLDELVPEDAARLTLAATMQERGQIIEKLGGKFYNSVKEYDGEACLRAWETMGKGDDASLEQTWAKSKCCE